MKYTAMYFLKKFDAIPEDQWITGEFVDDFDRKCVLGHCGVRATMNLVNTPYPEEAIALTSLVVDARIFAPGIVAINDGIYESDSLDPSDLGSTPKERVMNLLFLVNAGVKF
jgi:hypothetical protein